MKSSKVNSNNEIAKEAISKLKESFINGVQLSDLDFSEIQCVEERVFSLADSKQQQKAWNRISKQIDELNEFIIMHSDDNGRYIKNGTNMSKNFNIKSAQQNKRDYFDPDRKTNTYLFSNFRKYDENGNEYHTFDKFDSCKSNPIAETDYKISISQFCNLLTNEELNIFNLKDHGYSLQDCSQLSGLTYKQTRNKINKIRQKYSTYFSEHSQICKNEGKTEQV